ncbi:hypothetical protein V7158_23170 [Priestia megaterium]|uniref:hypothetical protein n=1 Tax=Priestia megaterium TaxID=1404 RepID=UPI002FFDD7D1
MCQSGNWVEQVFGSSILKRDGSNLLGFMFRNKNGKPIGLTASTIKVMFLSTNGASFEKQAMIANHYTATISITKNDIKDFRDMRIEFIIRYTDGNQDIFPSGNQQRISVMSHPEDIQKNEIGHIILEKLTAASLIRFEEPKEQIQTQGDQVNTQIKSSSSSDLSVNKEIKI